MSVPSFSEYYSALKNLEEAVRYNDGTLEGFFEEVEKRNLNLEMVTTGDIAQVTLPIKFLKSRTPTVVEEAPPDKDIEEWIKSVKGSFKKQYGEDYERILYALAWKKYNDSRRN